MVKSYRSQERNPTYQEKLEYFHPENIGRIFLALHPERNSFRAQELEERVVQEMLEKSKNMLKNYDVERKGSAAWETYFVACVKNSLRNALRARPPAATGTGGQETRLANLPGRTITPLEELLRNESEAEQPNLIEALKMLPNHQQDVVKLRHFGEMSFENISRVTGLPKPTAHRYYLNALKALRNLLTAKKTGEGKNLRQKDLSYLERKHPDFPEVFRALAQKGQQRVKQALEKTPDFYRNLFTARFIHGKTLEEIRSQHQFSTRKATINQVQTALITVDAHIRQAMESETSASKKQKKLFPPD